MAIDFHDLSAITDTLKYVYGAGITNQFADEKTTYNQFPVSERKPRGLGYEFSIRYARAQGTGARGESQKLPDPLVGKFDKGKILPKYIYGSIKLTGPMIEAAKSDVASFVDGLADSVDDIYQSIIVDLNRMAWNDGFGKIGTLSAASDALTTSATTWTVTMDNDIGVRYAKPGMVVDFFTSGGAVDESSVCSRISTIDQTAKTMEMEYNDGTYKTNHPSSTFAGYTIVAEAVVDAARMVKMGSRQAAAWTTASTAYEMMGLEGIYDDDTLLASFENIDTGTYPLWQANVLGNSSVNRELSIDLMLQGLDLTRMVSGKDVNIMRMGLGQRRKYANLLMPDVRFAPTVLKGGYETLTFAGGDGTVTIMIDPMAQPNKIYMEPGGTIQKFEMSPLGWGNIDQQWHQVAGYDEWSAFLRLYSNLGTEQRNNLTLLKDLVEPSLYS